MLEFSVEDDGVGMPREKAEFLLRGGKPEGRGGFGIHSSVVRTSLFYGVKDPVRIESEKGEGTRVTILVPVLQELPELPAEPVPPAAQKRKEDLP